MPKPSSCWQPVSLRCWLQFRRWLQLSTQGFPKADQDERTQAGEVSWAHSHFCGGRDRTRVCSHMHTVIPHALPGRQKWAWQGSQTRIGHLGPCFRFPTCTGFSPCPVLSLLLPLSAQCFVSFPPAIPSSLIFPGVFDTAPSIESKSMTRVRAWAGDGGRYVGLKTLMQRSLQVLFYKEGLL